MLKHLRLSNIGPADSIDFLFGNRLNLMTGDNGLGKSFVLDIAWWAMTRKWPAEINPKLTGTAFRNLCSVLDVLSPSPEETLRPGELTRII